MAFSRILYTPSRRYGLKLDNYIGYESLPLSLTVPQLADVLNISRNAAYALVHEPDFYPAFTIGRTIRVSRDSLLAWINDQHQDKGGNQK